MQGGGMEIIMAGNDTTELLKECEQGVKMGIEAISEVLPRTDDKELKNILNAYNDSHKKLEEELESLMSGFGIGGSKPNIMARGMSYLKTNFKMMMDDDDKTVADLMTDGCGMGIKSLNKYLNQYESADESAKDMTRRIIKIEEDFEDDLKKFL